MSWTNYSNYVNTHVDWRETCNNECDRLWHGGFFNSVANYRFCKRKCAGQHNDNGRLKPSKVVHGLGATSQQAMLNQFNQTSNTMIAVWAVAVAAGLGLTGYIVYRVTK